MKIKIVRIRYIIPFKRKVIIDDHWEIPMQGGKLRIVEEDGYANAIELIFVKQPIEYAPRHKFIPRERLR